jgi:tRNA(Arg) A34 adenosine deaminase TadA
MSKHHRFIEKALIEAKRSPVHIQVGAVLVKGRKVIAVGHNNYTHLAGHSHRVSPHWTIHAEVDAIRSLQSQSSFEKERKIYQPVYALRGASKEDWSER